MLYIISNFFVGGGYLYRLVPMPIIYLSANLLCSASKRHQQYIQIAKLKSSSLLRHTILLQNYILLLYYHRMRFGWILGIVGCWSERDMDMRRTAGLAPCSLLPNDARGHFGTNQKICWTTRVGSRSVRDDGQGYRHGRHAPPAPILRRKK